MMIFKNGEWRKGVKQQLATPNSNHWNNSLDWVPGDEKELFESSEETPSKKIYTKKPIKYTFNNLGWRTKDNFLEKDEPANLYLGCSHTFGQGLYYESTWAYKVNEYVKGKYYNVGWPGSSLTTEYRKLKIALRTYNIQNVFLFLPHYTRFEVYDPFSGKDGGYVIHNPAWDRPLGEDWLKVLSLSDNYNVAANAVISAMSYLCETYKVPFYSMDGFITHFIQTQKKFMIPDCPCGGDWDYETKGPHYARDNHHPACVHEYIADRYIEMYKNKIKPGFYKMDSYV